MDGEGIIKMSLSLYLHLSTLPSKDVSQDPSFSTDTQLGSIPPCSLRPLATLHSASRHRCRGTVARRFTGQREHRARSRRLEEVRLKRLEKLANQV